jgi:hypothetical protein
MARAIHLRALLLCATVLALGAACATISPGGLPLCESIGLRGVSKADPSVRYDAASGQYVHCPRYGALGVGGPRADDCVDGSMACIVP